MWSYHLAQCSLYLVCNSVIPLFASFHYSLFLCALFMCSCNASDDDSDTEVTMSASNEDSMRLGVRTIGDRLN